VNGNAVAALELELPAPMYEDLEDLVRVARGRYGLNTAEAAERLIAERLQEVLPIAPESPK